MCGITGWVDFNRKVGQEGDIIKKMTETLEARGPDAGGFWHCEHASLGHRRLVVLDPRGGKQPMTRRRGQKACTVTYNGELYNMAALREELAGRGHIFHSRNSDTEVLLLAYMEWGTECLSRINGIFAFAIWDEGEERLFLARDRLGVKPLFYKEHEGGLVWASELKAILAHPEIEAVVDGEGLAEVFLMGPSRTPGHGVYKGLKEIRPGHYIIFDRKGLCTRQYWALKSQPHQDTPEETALHIRDLLHQATRAQLISDVPVCTLLSGGLDSSALTAMAAPHIGKGMKTFSVDYQENDSYFRAGTFQPEADGPFIRSLVEKLGTDHRQVLVDNNRLAETLVPATLARDLPGMADIDASLYLFCREIKKEATVALSGEGADEILGGYPWFHHPGNLYEDAFPWIRFEERRLSLLREEVRNVLPKDYVGIRFRETLAETPMLPGEKPLEQKRRRLCYLNIIWFMATLLERKDRMSMASGLEVRVPFCDHVLVEYAWNIPWAIKNMDNMAKGILRRALKGILPLETRMRRKSPYPKTYHPAYLNAVKSDLKQVLRDSSAPLGQLVDTESLEDLMQSGKEIFPQPWFGQLMGDAQYYAYLLQVNCWLTHYGVKIKA